MKKFIFTVAVISALNGGAFAAPVPGCEGVDLKELSKKLENVISDCEFGNESKCFNEQIKGKDRLCAVRIGGMDPKTLTGLELTINQDYRSIEKE